MDELEQVRASMAAVPDPSSEVIARLRGHLAELIVSEEQEVRHAGTSGRHRRHRRALLGSLGAIAAGLLAVLLLPSTSGGPSPAAAALLGHLAAVAASQPATNPPGPGQFQYTKSEAAYDSCSGGVTASTLAGAASSPTPSLGYCALVSEERQIWIGTDGSGRILETFGQPEFASPADQARWVAAGSPSLGNTVSDTTSGPHTMSDGPPNFSTLSTDPTTLRAAISARKVEGGPPGPAEDFVQVGDLLRETDASPALRSALYQVAATIPGVELLGTLADHSGRVGTGIGYTTRGVRKELIFDPATSALLGEQDVAVINNPDGYTGAAGTVLDWAVYLSSGVVASLSDTPTGSAPSAPPVSCTADKTPKSITPGQPSDVQPVPTSEVYPAICTNVS